MTAAPKDTQRVPAKWTKGKLVLLADPDCGAFIQQLIALRNGSMFAARRRESRSSVSVEPMIDGGADDSIR